jgi:hypothetical protein
MTFTPFAAATAGVKAWQFTPETYGALGNGQVVGDVSTTSGSKVITSATAGFTAADVGKHVMINGGNGATSGPLIDVIASYQSATQVTLTTNNAGATASNCQMVWGSDDTAAINSAVAAAKTYALANTYFAEVVFGAKIYVLASGPTQSGNGSSTITYNAQIPLPYPGTGTTQSELGRKLVFKLTGAGNSGYAQYWDTTTPNITGTALVSMTTAPGTLDPTYGVQSVLGGPSSSAGFTGGSGVSVINYANTLIHMRDIGVWCGVYTNQTAFDFSYFAHMDIDRWQAHILSVPGYDGTPAGPLLKDTWTQLVTSNALGYGLRCPLGGNNVEMMGGSGTVSGYSYGVFMTDHLTMQRLTTVYTFIAGNINTGVGASVCHQITIQNWDCEATQGGLRSQAGGPQPVYINMDCETAAGSVAYDVSDASNALYGMINWTDPADNRSPVISGAAHLKVVNNFLGPGHWASPPGVPASTTAQQNTAFRDAAVTIATGAGVTVSVIAVDGTATGATLAASSSATVIVPSGKNITLTYAGGTPTWIWNLL